MAMENVWEKVRFGFSCNFHQFLFIPSQLFYDYEALMFFDADSTLGSKLTLTRATRIIRLIFRALWFVRISFITFALPNTNTGKYGAFDTWLFIGLFVRLFLFRIVFMWLWFAKCNLFRFALFLVREKNETKLKQMRNKIVESNATKYMTSKNGALQQTVHTFESCRLNLRMNSTEPTTRAGI